MIPHVQVRKVPGLDTRWQDRVDGFGWCYMEHHGTGIRQSMVLEGPMTWRHGRACADKNRNVFFDLYPWTSRIQTGKKHCSHYLDLCNSWDACESSWIRFFACILGSGWRETQEFSQIEQVFRKKWVARRTSTRWNTRYIIDPSSEMLWARIQYSRYIPGIFQVYSRYIPGIFQVYSGIIPYIPWARSSVINPRIFAKWGRQVQPASPWCKMWGMSGIIRNNSLINSIWTEEIMGNHDLIWFNHV